MKILLNLLPTEKKTEMLRNKRFRMIVAQGSGIIFLGFLYCCALLGISFLLSVQLSSMRGLSGGSSFVEEKNEIESYEAVFRETNAKASEISQLLGGHILWEKFFQSLEAATPPGVLYIKMLSKNDFSFSASGTAPDRDSLLLLEKNMNESDCFRSKDGGSMIPLSNKLVKENIDFQLDAMIERSCLVGIK